MNYSYLAGFIVCLILLNTTVFSTALTDTFEDNELTTNTHWTNPNDLNLIISTTTFKNGTHAMASMIYKAGYAYGDINNSLTDYNSWIRSPDVTSGGGTHIGIADATQTKYIQLTMESNLFKHRSGGGWVTFGDVPLADTWYKVDITYPNGNATYSIHVYNEAGAIVASAEDIAIIGDTFNAAYVLIYAQGESYFDDIDYGASGATITANYSYTTNKIINKLELTDTSTSEITTINDWNWVVDGTKISDAQDYNLSVIELTDYNVCLQVGDGTISNQKCLIIRIDDWTAPVTTFSYTLTSDTNNARITLTCTDNNSGCLITKYRIDGGSWQTATSGVAFDYNNTGYHYIDYNSTDNNANIETTKRSDLNMPVYLTIKYPKNEETLAQIVENWELDITGTVNFSYSDLNTDKNIYLPQNTPLTIKIVDSNGNYFSRTYVKDYNGYVLTDTLQPYLVDTTTGLLTTITTKDAYANTSLPGVTIKIYKDLDILGRTLVEELLTDSKGQALSLLVIGDKYEFETYYNGVFIKTFNITASSSAIYIYLTLPGTTPDINSTSFNALFTPLNPALTKLTVGNAVFTQTIFNFGETTATCVSTITQNGTVLSTQTATCSDANTVFTRTVAWTDINVGTVISTITVSGTGLTFTKNYTVSSSFGATYNILTGLSTGMRQDMGCSTDTSVPCMPLLIIAIILSIGLVLAGISMLGTFNTQASGLIFLIAIIFFTFIGWIPIILPAALVLIVLAFIVNERRQ